MYEVRFDHQVIALGTEEMALLDSSGATIIGATWADDEWTVTTASGDEYMTAANRQDAVQAMTQLAYETLGPNPNAREGVGDGYVTMVPPNIVSMS